MGRNRIGRGGIAGDIARAIFRYREPLPALEPAAQVDSRGDCVQIAANLVRAPRQKACATDRDIREVELPGSSIRGRNPAAGNSWIQAAPSPSEWTADPFQFGRLLAATARSKETGGDGTACPGHQR